MNEPAIDDLLSTALYSWYTEVAQWMPESMESTKPCGSCHPELKGAIDPAAWPHELVDGLAVALSRVLRQVAESILEDNGGDPEIVAALAEVIVMERFAQHRDDIRDVLEQCISHRREAFLELELDLAQLG
ncbi:MAG: hypothetical protein ABI632_03390 [Pseudolysinimonas sp.]